MLKTRMEPGFKLRGNRSSLFKDFKKLEYQYLRLTKLHISINLLIIICIFSFEKKINNRIL